MEQFDFSFAQGVDKKQIMGLASLGFIQRTENIVFLGPSGVGKTHLAIALGYLAAQSGLKTRFITAADLVILLENAYKEGKYEVVFRNGILSSKLLIIDELGYLPLQRHQADHFFQVIAKRYEKGLYNVNYFCRSASIIFADSSHKVKVCLTQSQRSRLRILFLLWRSQIYFSFSFLV